MAFQGIISRVTHVHRQNCLRPSKNGTAKSRNSRKKKASGIAGTLFIQPKPKQRMVLAFFDFWTTCKKKAKNVGWVPGL